MQENERKIKAECEEYIETAGVIAHYKTDEENGYKEKRGRENEREEGENENYCNIAPALKGDSNPWQRRAHKGGNTVEGQKNEPGKGNIKRGRH